MRRSDETRARSFIGRRAPAVGILYCAWIASSGAARAAPSPSAMAMATPTATATPTPPPPIPPDTPPRAVAAPSSATPTPTDATSALERVRAAYEYGDIDDVVEWSRQVAEGRLSPSPVQRAYALRYLGIGLYLTGRAPGAEAAFFELLRLHPDSRLDPRTTRPDVVAFFERVRVGHAQAIHDTVRANHPKDLAWNFFPPFGQFQNGDRGRGFAIAGLELASLATAVTTFAFLTHWEQPHHQFANYEQAHTTKIVNIVSVAVFGATYLVGIIDGLAHYADLPDDTSTAGGARLSLTADGLAFTF